MKNLTFCLALLLAAIPALAEEDAANGWRELKSIFENSTALPIQSVLDENVPYELEGKCFYRNGTITDSSKKIGWHTETFECVDPGAIFANNDAVTPYCRSDKVHIKNHSTYYSDISYYFTDKPNIYEARSFYNLSARPSSTFKFVEHEQNKYMIGKTFLFEDEIYCHYTIRNLPEKTETKAQPQETSWRKWLENLLGL